MFGDTITEWLLLALDLKLKIINLIQNIFVPVVSHAKCHNGWSMVSSSCLRLVGAGRLLRYITDACNSKEFQIASACPLLSAPSSKYYYVY